MTRKEIIQLLKLLADNYPNNRINDPEGTVQVWEMNLGSYEAPDIYKAARFHMAHCSFFPNPADLLKAIPRARLIYPDTEAPQIEHKQIQPEGQPEDRAGCTVCPVEEYCNRKRCAFE